MHLFERLFDIKRRELPRVQAFFLFLTTISIFYTMGTSVGDTLFLSRFGSQRAERLLPWVYIGTGLVTMALTWLYDRIADRFSRERFVTGVNLALALSLLIFRWAIRSEQLWLYYALVIWLEACALLALMLFFSFAGDYFTSRDARRFYGYINGGIAAGSIVGGFAVDRLALALGDDNLLYLCSGLLAASALWCVVIPLFVRPVDGETEGAESVLPLRSILSNRFLQIVVLLVLASQACGWLADYQFKIFASRHLQEEALAVFFGKFYSGLGLAQLLVQLIVVGWLLRRFGAIKSLLVLPALLCAVSGMFYLRPAFIVAAAGNFIRLMFLETLDEPTQELLFLPLPSRIRVRAQSFIEGMILPLGISLSGVLILAFSGFLRDLSQLSWLGLALGLIWMTAVVLLRPRYLEALAASLRRHGLDAQQLSSTLSSADGVKIVEDLLRAEDPAQHRLALDLWKGRPPGPLTDAFRMLVDSRSEPVAVAAIQALAGDGGAGHWPAIEPALDDPRADVRAAAISALFRMDPASAASRLPRWESDPAGPVRVAVLSGRLSHAGGSGHEAALPRLAELLKSAQAADRVVAAKVLTQTGDQATAQLFKQLLHDKSLEVRREVITAISASPDPEMVPWLLAQLAEESLRPLATTALEGMPLSAVPAFIDALAERERSLEERSLLIRTLGRFAGLRGAKVLWEILGSEEDVVLRVTCAQTLLHMQARNRAHDLSGYQDHGFLSRRMDELALINEAREEAGNAVPSYRQILLDHARLEVKGLLFTMALSSEGHGIEQIEASLFDGTEAQRANALELIEVIFPRDRASRLVSVVAPLIADQHAQWAGLRPGTISRLMQKQPWLRAATRHYLEAQGIAVDGGRKMSGQEAYLYKLMSRVSFLKKTRLFERVSANYLMTLAKIMQERTFCKDEILFSAGQKAEGFYLLCEGIIRLVVQERTVARLGPLDCVGEIALIEGAPYSAAAVAEQDLRAFTISSSDFNDVLLTHPEITVALLRHVSARLRDSLEREQKAPSEPREGV